MPRYAINLIGQKFARLLVIERAENCKRSGNARWVCKCDCGNMRTVVATSLRTGQQKSCGCYNRDRVAKLGEKQLAYNHPNWKGGMSLQPCGYIQVRAYRRREFEHRIIMESVIGRRLRSDELVHHINGIKTDNRPENLQLTTRSEHPGIHKRMRAEAA